MDTVHELQHSPRSSLMSADHINPTEPPYTFAALYIIQRAFVVRQVERGMSDAQSRAALSTFINMSGFTPLSRTSRQQITWLYYTLDIVESHQIHAGPLADYSCNGYHSPIHNS